MKILDNAVNGAAVEVSPVADVSVPVRDYSGEWYRFYQAGLKLHDNDDIYVLVNEHHTRNTDGNFQSKAYGNFYFSGDLYFAFHMAGAENRHMDSREIGGELWKRLLVSLTGEKKLRSGAEFPNVKNLWRLFFVSFCERYELDASDEDVMKNVRGRYMAYMAAQLNGVVAEFRTYENLVARLGEERVRWADASEEKTEVDLYVDGLPVSVKNYGAFSTHHFNDYRLKQGRDRPVLYVNEQLRTAVPFSAAVDEKGKVSRWGYTFEGESELERVIASIGGKPLDVPQTFADAGDASDWDNLDEFMNDDALPF